ncbi:hypothetical protein HDU93_010105 [Gonapodya sp. JEL0774]|nr:hypothetical protein HDU93_010105 [Gonapodya sp. JEL0774]
MLTRAREAVEKTLNDLGLEYLDLYLLHWPVCFFPVDPPRTYWAKRDPVNNVAPQDPEYRLEDTWKVMEELYTEGKVRAIGVSNYTVELLEGILKFAKVPPAVNQYEAHPYLTQTELLSFCNANSIHVTAYSPLGAGKSAPPVLLEDATVVSLAHTKGCTPAQLLINWGVARGCSVIPRTSNPKRVLENFVRVELSEADMKLIEEKIIVRKRYIDPIEFWRGILTGLNSASAPLVPPQKEYKRNYCTKPGPSLRQKFSTVPFVLPLAIAMRIRRLYRVAAVAAFAMAMLATTSFGQGIKSYNGCSCTSPCYFGGGVYQGSNAWCWINVASCSTGVPYRDSTGRGWDICPTNAASAPYSGGTIVNAPATEATSLAQTSTVTTSTLPSPSTVQVPIVNSQSVQATPIYDNTNALRTAGIAAGIAAAVTTVIAVLWGVVRMKRQQKREEDDEEGHFQGHDMTQPKSLHISPSPVPSAKSAVQLAASPTSRHVPGIVVEAATIKKVSAEPQKAVVESTQTQPVEGNEVPTEQRHSVNPTTVVNAAHEAVPMTTQLASNADQPSGEALGERDTSSGGDSLVPAELPAPTTTHTTSAATLEEAVRGAFVEETSKAAAGPVQESNSMMEADSGTNPTTIDAAMNSM